MLHRRNTGNTLVVTLTTITVLSVLIGTAVSLTQTVARNTDRARARSQAIAFADAAIESAFAQWRRETRSAAPPDAPAPSENYFASRITAPTTTELPGSYTLRQLRVAATDPRLNLQSANQTPVPSEGVNAQDKTYYYLAMADVVMPGVQGTVEVKVRRVFAKRNQSPWQYAIFFNDRLEFHPGPSQIVDGWVHTNSNLYTAQNSLQFKDKVTFAGEHYLGYDPGNGARGGTVITDSYGNALYRTGGDILNGGLSDNWSPDKAPARSDTESVVDVDPYTAFDPNVFDPNTPANSNQDDDGYHELIECPVNAPGKPDPISNQRLYKASDYRVFINAGNAITVKDSNDQVLPTSDPAHQAIVNALTTNEALRDHREGAEVRIASLDVAKITKAVDQDGVLDKIEGTVIYISDTSVGTAVTTKVGGTTTVTTSKRGIRLRNGATLPGAGLTIVSDNPVYIQGDYNTGGSTSNQPASNTTSTYGVNDPAPSPTVSGYTRKPAAVIGDAVNILSNSWLDINSLSNTRVATSTTVNTAIVSGNVASGSSGGNYSGGAENFPRFLENWSGKYFTYYGSMIQLYRSKQAVGLWENANYSPPNRRWFFDQGFRTNPPPGILRTVSYSKRQWFLE